MRDVAKSPTRSYSSDVANSVVIMVSANRVIQKGQKEHTQGQKELVSEARPTIVLSLGFFIAEFLLSSLRKSYFVNLSVWTMC